MNLKIKILLLALLPLLCAATVLSVLGLNHARNLADQVLNVYEYNLLEARQQALKDKMDLARSAIEYIRSNPELSEAEAQAEVKELLSTLTFSEDGYFFAYTQDGLNIVHPTIPEFVGEDMYNFQDINGNYLIQHLLDAANSGGGYHRYFWERPPSMEMADKLSYADLIEPWGWMYGTGLYLDSIAAEVDKVKTSFDNNVRDSFVTLMTVILITVLVIILFGLAINLHEHKLADTRLQGLVQKFLRLQVNERRKFSRELHDGINQQLVSLKLRIELAEKKMSHSDTQQSALSDLDIASNILNSTIQEVRQISHDLRPVMLDDLGLLPALRGLIEQFSEHTNIQVRLDYGLEDVDVSDDIETTIYRITQECLHNIKKHAEARRVTIRLRYAQDQIYFDVTDNGRGFDPKEAQNRGIGLINMKERVEVIGGTLSLQSSPGLGATVSAILPCKQRWRHSA